MDKRYPDVHDVANATMEDVARTLHRVLRTVEGRTQFLFRADFEFANGRKGPLLMVGALRGGWREYIRRNTGSPAFAAGECEVHRDPSGRPVIEMQPSRGRGGGPLHARSLAGLMRDAGADGRFVAALGEAAAPGPAASPAADGAGAAPSAAAPAPADAKPVRAEHAGLVKRFNEFKAKPTAEGLDALIAAIEHWKALRDALPDPAAETKASQQVETLERLLVEKGHAFVARASSS